MHRYTFTNKSRLSDYWWVSLTLGLVLLLRGTFLLADDAGLLPASWTILITSPHFWLGFDVDDLSSELIWVLVGIATLADGFGLIHSRAGQAIVRGVAIAVIWDLVLYSATGIFANPEPTVLLGALTSYWSIAIIYTWSALAMATVPLEGEE